MKFFKKCTHRFAAFSMVAVVTVLFCSVYFYYNAVHTDSVLNWLDISRKLLILTRSLAVMFFAVCNLSEKIRIKYDKSE